MGLKDKIKYVPSVIPTASTAKQTYDYYVDPTVPTIEELREQAEAEKSQAEAKTMKGREEWAVNKEIAKVGKWETVVVQPPALCLSNHQTSTDGNNKNDSGSTHDQGAEFQDDDEDEEDLHTFKVREKELDIPIEEDGDKKDEEAVTFKKRKVADSTMKSRKKKPLRKKD
jgi:ABC-type proline/glycine betaine transport system substrate-binding protein